jgi:hypothetical protein
MSKKRRHRPRNFLVIEQDLDSPCGCQIASRIGAIVGIHLKCGVQPIPRTADINSEAGLRSLDICQGTSAPIWVRYDCSTAIACQGGDASLVVSEFARGFFKEHRIWRSNSIYFSPQGRGSQAGTKLTLIHAAMRQYRSCWATLRRHLETTRALLPISGFL